MQIRQQDGKYGDGPEWQRKNCKAAEPADERNKRHRRQKRAGLQERPCSKLAEQGTDREAELEATIAKALRRIGKLKTELDAARSEAWLKKFSVVLSHAGLGSAGGPAKPSTTKQEAAAMQLPLAGA